MAEAFICDYVRTPFTRYGGALSSLRPDDLGALPIRALLSRQPYLEGKIVDEIIYGCANQAGEDNRNIARMSSLLAGLPVSVPATTINRLCGSGMDSILIAARAIQSGQMDLVIAGGVESMSRAPFVMPKATSAFTRNNQVFDTTIGWRFVNPLMKDIHGVDSMPETAENVAEQFDISREAQDRFSCRSQQRADKAQQQGRFDQEIIPVTISQRKADAVMVTQDEHLRPDTNYQQLAALPTPFREKGTVTAGNASGVNDGAAAMIIASEQAIERYNLTPIARISGGATAGVEPRIMGYGPVPATQKLLKKLGRGVSDIDMFEINEAFAAQALATTRALGLADDADHVNPNGGAIALGHPLGASGARITGTLALELKSRGLQKGIATMCVGVGQGIAIALDAV
jgi:3-oxoadipyl-CoA thiolase